MNKSGYVIFFVCIIESIISREIWAVDMMNTILQNNANMSSTLSTVRKKQGVSNTYGNIMNQLTPPPQPLDQIVEIQSLAAQGNPDAQINLGAYYRSIGNEIEATRWFSLAAERGESQAQVFLGYRYLYGIGAQKNLDLATFWLRKAADKGEQAAREALLSHPAQQAE